MKQSNSNQWDLSDVSREYFEELAKSLGVTLDQCLILFYTGCSVGLTNKEILLDYLLTQEKGTDPFFDDLIKHAMEFEVELENKTDTKLLELFCKE